MEPLNTKDSLVLFRVKIEYFTISNKDAWNRVLGKLKERKQGLLKVVQLLLIFFISLLVDDISLYGFPMVH